MAYSPYRSCIELTAALASELSLPATLLTPCLTLSRTSSKSTPPLPPIFIERDEVGEVVFDWPVPK
jgi:hypothetical protein